MTNNEKRLVVALARTAQELHVSNHVGESHFILCRAPSCADAQRAMIAVATGGLTAYSLDALEREVRGL